MKSMLMIAASALALAAPAFAADAPSAQAAKPADAAAPLLTADSATSEGSVTIGGQRIDYDAVAGTLVVHPKGWDDSAPKDDADNPTAVATMSYVAYFKKGAPSADRPITFFYNGGPGSSTVWLHMGAFGPKRIVTLDDSHTPAAPYQLVDNAYSLLDATDLVFVDAPGTGFGRLEGKDKEKAFWGADPDAYAFSQFIQAFLSQHGRWNSPKFLFGESYGTPRSAILVNELENDDDMDVNGVILLSQILNYDLNADQPELNPGADEAYVTALPTYAATAWYHNRLPGQRPAELEPFLREVEQFAGADYAQALQAGASLDPARKQAVAEKLAQYTGLPVDYLLKANLRVDGGEFEKTLQDAAGLTTGRLDTRFSGPTLDPLSKEAGYDPQSAAIGSAYVSAFNDYVRNTLGFGKGRTYKPEIDLGDKWRFEHTPPGAGAPVQGVFNVMPDLAQAMKINPDLRVMVNGGYYDLATPYFQGIYEMRHLPIPQSLQANIEYRYYQSGHMVYANEASLKQLHDNVADFIRRTDAVGR